MCAVGETAPQTGPGSLVLQTEAHRQLLRGLLCSEGKDGHRGGWLPTHGKRVSSTGLAEGCLPRVQGSAGTPLRRSPGAKGDRRSDGSDSLGSFGITGRKSPLTPLFAKGGTVAPLPDDSQNKNDLRQVIKVFAMSTISRS